MDARKYKTSSSAQSRQSSDAWFEREDSESGLTLEVRLQNVSDTPRLKRLVYELESDGSRFWVGLHFKCHGDLSHFLKGCDPHLKNLLLIKKSGLFKDKKRQLILDSWNSMSLVDYNDVEDLLRKVDAFDPLDKQAKKDLIKYLSLDQKTFDHVNDTELKNKM